MIKLDGPGPFTVLLRNGVRVTAVYRTKDPSDYYYTAYNEPPTDEDLERPWRSPKLKRSGPPKGQHYAWYALGKYTSEATHELDIIEVVWQEPTTKEEPKPMQATYLIAIDVRDNQPLMFALAGVSISKQIDPLIKQLENQYHINASTDHDGAMENKLIENVRKLKSADMVIRFDGHWWPVRFVKTVNSFQEGLESI